MKPIGLFAKTYKNPLAQYHEVIEKMGLSKCHGLRHAYAQRRYLEITKSYDKTGNLIPLKNIGIEPQGKLLASRLSIQD